MRELKTAAELRALIAERMAELEVCQELQPNEVYWHEADETGCNWSLHSFGGIAAMAQECWEALSGYLAELRERYKLEDPE
jgi:hypothetical protein